MEIGSLAAHRLEKSSRSRICATVTLRTSRNRSSVGMSSHSELKRTSSRSSVGEHLARLFHVRARVRVDLLAREHGPGRRAPARVAHAGGVVADDQHHRVAGVLELAQLLQHDGVAEVDVRGGRVEPELDAQRAAARQLLRERPAGQVVDGVAREVRRRFGGLRGRFFHPAQC